MVFKNPLFLYLLPLPLILLLLHLLFLKFIKTIPFPWLGFVKEKEDERRKRKKIKELLILLTRILFLLSFLLFLSSPFVKRKVFPDEVIFDSSESTLLWKKQFGKVYRKLSEILGKEKIKKMKYFSTLYKKGNIFVITDGEKNFFKKMRKSKGNFFIFIPEEKREDVGIKEVEIRDGILKIWIYSSTEVPDGEIKLIADENPFSYKIKLKRGLNNFEFPLKVQKFHFLKIHVLPYDSLSEDNIYYLSKPRIKKYYRIFGKSSMYLRKILEKMGYREVKETGDSIIHIFYTFPQNKETLRIFQELIEANKPLILFMDRENEIIDSELKKDINIKVKEEIIHFWKILNIKKGKPLVYYKGISLLSLYRNSLIFGFLPEPEWSDIIYSPSFLYLLKEGIKNLKIPVPEVLKVKKDTFIYFDDKEYRIYDSQGNFLKKDYTDNKKIYFHELPYGSYVIKNSKIIYIDINFSPEEIPVQRINKNEIKDVLPAAEVHRLKELKNFLPLSLKKTLLSISIFFILLEIFLIILL